MTDEYCKKCMIQILKKNDEKICVNCENESLEENPLLIESKKEKETSIKEIQDTKSIETYIDEKFEILNKKIDRNYETLNEKMNKKFDNITKVLKNSQSKIVDETSDY